ncbi:hypothetical protein GFS31_41550 (plasmid) [Leptolyngbya sp. BL0902]|uniref:hypothetical protein n=1 Tax=Leptolyngbya sp. BL0902 TaxID=1115757 RepID=UPI0018E78ACD|nr:hypothetical protein [Leptolyngbya sp. BL0902]QQE67442.1 hypothetical protein GFS31_41550 [Leptolyngbya sp. BL0902]
MLNRLVMGVLVASGLGVALVLPNLSYAQSTHTGIVERVWEDGFRLNTGERTLRVDTWDVYGDNTARYVSVGDELTITGEFEGREFDAFTITGAAAGAPAPAATNRPADDMTVSSRQSSTTYNGTVERVWEDGFQLNTGDRTLRVDTWDVYGDNTASYVSAGDRVTVTGEFDDGEFDAFTVRPTP